MRLALALSLLAAACSAAPAPAPAPPPAAPPVAVVATVAPARWAFVDRLGVVFDEGGHGSALPRPEPAIIDGVRVVVDAGIVVGSARHADRFIGFRELPGRLGGGFVLWSDDRVYRSGDFLGEPVAIADLGVLGARPWLASVLLRTPLGFFELDPRGLALRRAALPGVADALALDARRAVRLDVLGRASFTVDGGASWTDVLAARGVVVRSLGEDPGGGIALASDSGSPLLLGPGGLAPAPVTPSPVEPITAEPLLAAVRPASSRALPDELLAHAVASGALLPGGRLVVAREGGVRVLAARTMLPIADADLPGIDPRFAHCQAIPVGSPPAALACVAESGAAVIDLDGSLRRPALEATFPAGGGGFSGGARGRLVFDGRCGPEPPTSADLGPGSHPPEAVPDEGQPPAAPPPEEPTGPVELPPDDDARACVRVTVAHWVERRLRGDDARHLYRWIPGEGAAVTALVLSPGAGSPHDAGSPAPSIAGDGVRVIRVDPGDPALAGGAFPAVPPPSREPPYRSVDVDFWQDDDGSGSVRGWIALPGEGREKVPAPPSAQGPAHRILPVATRRGGRRAGVRIDAAGHLTVYPLPEGVTDVVTGGPFALAMGTTEQRRTWFESLDGGATWAPVLGPPVGAIEPPLVASSTFACSAAGCAWEGGAVRLGWGGPRPAPPPALALTPAVGPRPHEPEPLAISCRLDKDPFAPAAKTAAAPVALQVGSGQLRLRASGEPASFLPFPMPLRSSVAADGPEGSLVLLDADRGVVSVSRGALTSQAVHLTRVADVSRLRLTLARRLAGGGLAVAAYATSSGDLVAGDLDVGRAEVGPLVSLGRLEKISDAGACPGATHRVLVELPVRVRLTGAARFDGQETASAVILAGQGHVCVEAVELAIRRASPVVLRASFGAGGRASVWSAAGTAGGECAIEGR